MLGLSRTRTAELAESGLVTQGLVVLGKADRLAEGIVTIEFPAARVAAAEPGIPGGLVVAYEDEDVVVVDKPVGVAAHASPGWTGPTVVGGLAAAGIRVAEAGAAERQGIVHRLDVGTSGLMVVAKTDHAYTVLKRAFKERTVEKIYHAVAQGHPDPTSGTIDAPIGRHPSSDYKFAVVEGGRPSITHYEVLEMFPPLSSRYTWKPAAPTRSACTWRRCATRSSATSRTARIRRLPAASASRVSGCTRASSRLSTPRKAARCG